jgi:hypothetical protein
MVHYGIALQHRRKTTKNRTPRMTFANILPTYTASHSTRPELLTQPTEPEKLQDQFQTKNFFI